MIYRFATTQADIAQICEAAEKRRAKAPDLANKYKDLLNTQPLFKSEKEALQFAIDETKEKQGFFYVFAETKRVNNKCSIVGYYCATLSDEAAIAADFLGWIQLYDSETISRIIADKKPLSEIIP